MGVAEAVVDDPTFRRGVEMVDVPLLKVEGAADDERELRAGVAVGLTGRVRAAKIQGSTTEKALTVNRPNREKKKPHDEEQDQA